MKHSVKITLIILALFFASQIVGLAIVNEYIDTSGDEVVYKELPIGERPALNEELSYIPIMITLLVGTGILLLLIKFKVFFVWKFFFLVAVFIALFVSFGAFFPFWLSGIIAAVLAGLKIFRPRIILHNVTEVLIYGGLAAIFVPLLTITSAIILLILISLYDMYAVWKSKHMVKLAKFQTQVKVFAGLMIPYGLPKGTKKVKKNVENKKNKMVKVRTAMLGGGDIGFPLIFSGVIMISHGFLKALLISLFAGIALLLLMMKGEEKKFYPAMPFITAGCLVGYGILLLL